MHTWGQGSSGPSIPSGQGAGKKNPTQIHAISTTGISPQLFALGGAQGGQGGGQGPTTNPAISPQPHISFFFTARCPNCAEPREKNIWGILSSGVPH